MIKIKAMIDKNKGRPDFLQCSEFGYMLHEYYKLWFINTAVSHSGAEPSPGNCTNLNSFFIIIFFGVVFGFCY